MSFLECLVINWCYLGIRNHAVRAYSSPIVLNKLRPILHDILKKYVKAYMLLRYLYCTKSPFQKNLIPTFKSFLSQYGHTGCLQKSKSKGIVNILPNVFLIAFSCVITFIAVPSAFLHQPGILNHSLIIYLINSFSSCFSHITIIIIIIILLLLLSFYL